MRHSLNIAARPDVAIVIYDSRTTPDERQAMYIGATATELEGGVLDEGHLGVLARVAVERLPEWPRECIATPADFPSIRRPRTAWFILADGADERLPFLVP